MVPVEDVRKLSEFLSRSSPDNAPVAVKERKVPDPSEKVPDRNPVPSIGLRFIVDQR